MLSEVMLHMTCFTKSFLETFCQLCSASTHTNMLGWVGVEGAWRGFPSSPLTFNLVCHEAASHSEMGPQAGC